MLAELPCEFKKLTTLPLAYTVLGWETSNIMETVKDLDNKGVQFELYSALPQDDLGIWTTPDGAKVAWFKDPDGNTLSITQMPA